MRYVMRRGAICAVTECWFGDHGTLERHHHYIQWLFPVYENSGVNRHASALRRAEAREMRRDLGVARRAQSLAMRTAGGTESLVIAF